MLPKAMVQALSNDIKQFAPFDKISAEHIQYFISQAKLAYYAPDQVIISDCQFDKLIFIKQGEVYCEALEQSQQVPDLMTSGELFPIEHLAHNTPINHLYRAKNHVFCYEIDRHAFDKLSELSEHFKIFCNAQLSNLLAEARKNLQKNYADLVEIDPLELPLSKVIKFKPITCLPDTPISEVMEIMQEKKIGAMIIADPEGIPLGIFTLKDLLKRVVLTELNYYMPIDTVMTAHPFTLQENKFAYEAVLALTQQKFRHAIVVDSHTGKIVGVISEKDLFSLRRASLRQISDSLNQAKTPEALKESAQAINLFAHNMLVQGISADQIKLFITTLRDLLFEQSLKIILKDYPVVEQIFKSESHVKLALIGLGRHGRNELNLGQTQKLALIYSDPELKYSQIFNQFFNDYSLLLLNSGFAKEVTICVPVEDWQSSIRHILELSHNMDSNESQSINSEVDAESSFVALNQLIEQMLANNLFSHRVLASYLLDTHLIYGHADVVDHMKEWVKNYFIHNKPSLKTLAEMTLQDGTIESKVNHWLTKRLGGVDLSFVEMTEASHKLFVHVAQVLALYSQSTQVNTIERLRDTLPKVFQMTDNEVRSYTEAYNFIELLELRENSSLDQLNSLEQRLLKEAFKQARKLKVMLEKQILNDI